jgi:hypothetical protein
MRLYLNGVQVATNPHTAAITSGPVTLGLGNRAYDAGLNYDLNGLLDEIRISNTTRSVAWINASYESGRDHLIDFGAVEIYPSDIENIPTSKDFGGVDEHTGYWANGSAPTFPLDDAECFFTIINNSTCPLAISVRATDFLNPDLSLGWTLAGSPGEDIVTLKAGREGDDEGDLLILTIGDQDFILSLGVSQSMGWEIKLETGDFIDYARKTSTITLTATSA